MSKTIFILEKIKILIKKSTIRINISPCKLVEVEELVEDLMSAALVGFVCLLADLGH